MVRTGFSVVHERDGAAFEATMDRVMANGWKPVFYAFTQEWEPDGDLVDHHVAYLTQEIEEDS